MDWFLYDNGLRHERVKLNELKVNRNDHKGLISGGLGKTLEALQVVVLKVVVVVVVVVVLLLVVK